VGPTRPTIKQWTQKSKGRLAVSVKRDKLLLRGPIKAMWESARQPSAEFLWELGDRAYQPLTEAGNKKVKKKGGGDGRVSRAATYWMQGGYARTKEEGLKKMHEKEQEGNRTNRKQKNEGGGWGLTNTAGALKKIERKRQ